MKQYSVGGVILPNAPIMVGAGVCKSPHSAREWLTVAPVVSGSYTPQQRDGNKGDRLFYPDTEQELRTNGFGLNSFGMPNMSVAAAAAEFADYAGEQPLVASLAGFSVDDYVNGVELLAAVESVSAIELNFGCPNTEHGKIMSFDLNSLDALLQQLQNSDARPLWLKFSPYSDPGFLKEVAAVINTASAVVRAVVTCNTFPNAYAGRDCITPMGGMAGLSGPALKPIALGQVVQFRQQLVSEIDVIGVGGALTGNDVVDFLNAGARGVQLTSLPFWLGSPESFWEALLNSETGDRLETFLSD